MKQSSGGNDTQQRQGGSGVMHSDGQGGKNGWLVSILRRPKCGASPVKTQALPGKNGFTPEARSRLLLVRAGAFQACK